MIKINQSFLFLSIVLFVPTVIFADTINGLSVVVNSNGDVPPVTISCEPNNDYTLLLVHQDSGVVQFSPGPIQRAFCGDDGQVTFNGFNISNYLISSLGTNFWWQYVRSPLEYIIKNTTGLGYCDSITSCYLINLQGAWNNYDYSVQLASSTYWKTIGAGPIFDSLDNVTWFNKANGDGSLNVSTTSINVATGTSVMFFPGIMGSRLYENGDELWVSTSDSKQAKLSLDQNGKSINQVYTKDDTESVNDEPETGITDEIYGFNIYNTFINSLRTWKTDGVIKDYAFIPYDWRLSLDDIITKGATSTGDVLTYNNNQDFSESYILKKLNELSQKSSKIVLIGHSNGGLVIKALVQKLKDTNNPLYYKIDKIIFVAVPQIGTPEAIVSLLHGTDLGSGFVMSNERARSLSENMSTVYNLIPSDNYFTSVDQTFAVDKVVSFENNSAFFSQLNQYGAYVSDKTELKNFILGSDGRTKPPFDDTDSPSIGNTTLYNSAVTVHSILDNFEPASTTKIIQIAGWGEETLSGLDYVRCFDRSVDGYHKCFKPRFVVDGDGTVVIPSALWISTSTPNIERWWVNLAKFNNESLINRKHKDVTEIQKLNDFIRSKIEDSSFVDPESIVVNNTSTLISGKIRLHYTLHSPLTLGVEDVLGKYTGLDPVTGEVKEDVPNVVYKKIGKTQFISIPSNFLGKIKLKGYDVGDFALDIEKQEGNNVTEKVSFQGIPSSTTTTVTLDINNFVASSTLNVDINSDGFIDKTINSDGQSVVLYDDIPPEILITFSTSTNDILFKGVDTNLVSVDVGTSTVVATDSQSNKTTLYFMKKGDGSEYKLTLNKIVRNGIVSSLQNSEIKFKIEKNKIGAVKEFESSVEVKDAKLLEVKYNLDKKLSSIREKINGIYVTTIRQGFIIESILTTLSGLKFIY